ncbi:MAG: type III pantothenate kinase [Christensenellales bacterium]|jgi:type III pantothenate kinase
MILVLDIGNTNIKTGLFDGSKLCASWRMATDRLRTSDEYGVYFDALLRFSGYDKDDILGVIMSSVVPASNYTMEHMIRDFFGRKPIMVGPGVKTGLNILYEDPREVGSDRIVTAVAAYTRFGGPCIVVDFGTATTFNVISKDGAFLGGAICPGLKVATDALVKNTSKLPTVELTMPESVIGRTTVSNMQAGIIYGYVGQVEYIVKKMKDELGDKNAYVVATGGLAHLIAVETNCFDAIDQELSLYGLNILYQRNFKNFEQGKGTDQ